MRKKQIGQKVAVALFAAMLALSGCSKPVDSPKQDPGAQSSPGEKTEGQQSGGYSNLSFFWWGSDIRHEDTLMVLDL